MILVLLGTQNNSFHRLLEEIDRLIEKKIISEKVVAQAGYTKYTPQYASKEQLQIIDFVDRETLAKYQDEASFIITHGGVGSIISSIEKSKKVIAVPRKHQYEEHVNDHQKDIVELFNQKGYIIGIGDVRELEDAIERVKDFVPKKYEHVNQKMLKIITDFIENS